MKVWQKDTDPKSMLQIISEAQTWTVNQWHSKIEYVYFIKVDTYTAM